MLTPEKFQEETHYFFDVSITALKAYHEALLKSIIEDLEANRNKNAVEYLKSKL